VVVAGAKLQQVLLQLGVVAAVVLEEVAVAARVVTLWSATACSKCLQQMMTHWTTQVRV
jgi:hypothetical protein